MQRRTRIPPRIPPSLGATVARLYLLKVSLDDIITVIAAQSRSGTHISRVSAAAPFAPFAPFFVFRVASPRAVICIPHISRKSVVWIWRTERCIAVSVGAAGLLVGLVRRSRWEVGWVVGGVGVVFLLWRSGVGFRARRVGRVGMRWWREVGPAGVGWCRWGVLVVGGGRLVVSGRRNIAAGVLAFVFGWGVGLAVVVAVAW